MIASWTAAAEQFIMAAWEMGFDIAATVASAWQARCDPDATRGLVRAAYALSSGDALQSMWVRGKPCPSAEDYLAAAEEHQAQASVLSAQARDMAAACESARDDAIDEREKAVQQARRAQAVMGAATDPGAKAAAEAAWRAALERAEQLARVIADCDAALDIIADVRERLNYAVSCFLRVPADLEETYDRVLQLVRDGGTLPWRGDFLTGSNPVETITNGRQR